MQYLYLDETLLEAVWSVGLGVGGKADEIEVPVKNPEKMLE
jgi:hypothetical protein